MDTVVQSNKLVVQHQVKKEDEDDDNDNDDVTVLKFYRLELHGVTVELCSLGASIVQILLPRCSRNNKNTDDRIENSTVFRKEDNQLQPLLQQDVNEKQDNVVLGYDPSSIHEMWESGNPMYFGVIVGPVANRIRLGQFQTIMDGPVYTLDRNEDKIHHLHGGSRGYSKQNWDSSILVPVQPDAMDAVNHPPPLPATTASGTCSSVQFQLHSFQKDDQGYPGDVQICVTYTLRPTPSPNAVILHLSLTAEFVCSKENTFCATPINLTQHTYFNLDQHDAMDGILDHTLRLYSDTYTPLIDSTMIPTGTVQSVHVDPCMDWTYTRRVQEALLQYGTEKMGLDHDQVQRDLQHRCNPLSKGPYGFDHNYIVMQPQTHSVSETCDNNTTNTNIINNNNNNNNNNNEMHLVAVLQHPKTQRRMTLRSTQPGVQLYTGNHLSETVTVPTAACKDKNVDPNTNTSTTTIQYNRWQGLCLEPQHFPDSILVDATKVSPSFAVGQCPILTSDSPHYKHEIEYTFEFQSTTTTTNTVAQSNSAIMEQFYGSDSDNNLYESVNEMWDVMLGTDQSDTMAWYQRAATHYRNHCPPTVDGVLGGFAMISDIDLEGSLQFVHDLELIRPSIRMWTRPNNSISESTTTTTTTTTSNSSTKNDSKYKYRACECGAGLGRVTKGLLLSQLGGIDSCDLVESASSLLAVAPDYLGNIMAEQCRFFCVSLQEWEPSCSTTYAVIWIQWVLSYLVDDDIVQFLKRCGASLMEDGFIILKENICTDSDFEVDLDDASVTRSLRYWKYLIHKAGLRIVYEKFQEGLPEHIYSVPMLALEVNVLSSC